jgi:hypothetical protein
MTIEILVTSLFISVGLNLALAFAVTYYRKPKPPPDKTKQMLDILTDLNNGGAHLIITRVDPMDVFHVSPRDRGRI